MPAALGCSGARGLARGFPVPQCNRRLLEPAGVLGQKVGLSDSLRPDSRCLEWVWPRGCPARVAGKSECLQPHLSGLKFGWSCGREAEGGGLLNRYTVVKPYRGFESLRLRHPSPAQGGDNRQDFTKAKDGGAGSVNGLPFAYAPGIRLSKWSAGPFRWPAANRSSLDKIADRQFWARTE